MKTKTLLLAAVAFTACAAPAFAQTSVAWETPKKGDFLVSGRVTDVFSEADDAITKAAGADTGLKVDVGDSVMPTLGFTYFLTDHLAVEAILGTTQHEIRAQGGATDVAVHETWVPFDPSRGRVESADKGFAEDRLIVLQSGVGDHVHELGHERAPELDQGVLGRVRTRIPQGRGQVVEGGVGLRGSGEGGVEVGHRTIPFEEENVEAPHAQRPRLWPRRGPRQSPERRAACPPWRGTAKPLTSGVP